jgi:hypothetical protein
MKTVRVSQLVAGMAAFALPLIAPFVLAAPAAPPDAGKPSESAAPPEDWIIYDETTYSPVVDDVDRHLAAARAAFSAQDRTAAAVQLRKVSEELRAQSASAMGLERVRARDEGSSAAEQDRMATQTVRRMKASAAKVDAAALAVENGKITTIAQLDKAIDKADRADMDQRWRISEVSTWYPLVRQPQNHFTTAAAAFSDRDYALASAEIRKGASYIRNEASRASGSARSGLEDSARQLEDLAGSVQTGSEQDAAVLRRAFATANRALAIEYRTLASRSWERKDYDEAGHELHAAAQSLESGAGWLGEQARSGAAATVADTRTLGDKLSNGAKWSQEEVAKGLVKLGNGIEDMGRKINPKIAGG